MKITFEFNAEELNAKQRESLQVLLGDSSPVTPTEEVKAPVQKAPVQKPTAKAAALKATATKAPAPKQAPKGSSMMDDGQDITLDDIKDVMRPIVEEYTSEIKDKLDEYGATNIKSLDPDLYPDFYEFLTGLTA